MIDKFKIKKMKILESFIVTYYGKPQLLFVGKDEKYFITNNGAFNQRDMTIIELDEEEALKLINHSVNNKIEL